MKEKQFQTCLSLYGTDLTRWPEGLQKEARESLAASSELRSLFDQEVQLEKRLQIRRSVEPSSQLTERILKAAAQTPQKVSQGSAFRDWLLGSWGFKPIFALGLILMIGFTVGYFSTPKKEAPTPATDLASLLYHDEDALWGLNSK